MLSVCCIYQVRFGVALVGRAGAGKSVVRRLLAEGSTWLRAEELSQVSHATMELICTGCTGMHRFAISMLCFFSGPSLFCLILANVLHAWKLLAVCSKPWSTYAVQGVN